MICVATSWNPQSRIVEGRHIQHIPAVSNLSPRFRICTTRDTLSPCHPTTTLQDGQPTLMLGFYCAQVRRPNCPFQLQGDL
jgi:hypothetical protein